MIMSLDKRCLFPKPGIKLRILLLHALFFPILYTIDIYKVTKYRWNKPYGIRCTYTILFTRICHSVFMFYAILSPIVILTSIIENTTCSLMDALNFYLIMVFLIIIMTASTTHWKGHNMLGVDCVYALMIISVFLTAFELNKVDTNRNCYIFKCNTRCYLTFNIENWDYLNFPDILSVW